MQVTVLSKICMTMFIEKPDGDESIEKLRNPEMVKKFSAFCGILGSLRFHKNPPLIRILSQLNPVHVLKSCFFKLNFNIIHYLRLWKYSYRVDAKEEKMIADVRFQSTDITDRVCL
jgi:hypothetical protein